MHISRGVSQTILPISRQITRHRYTVKQCRIYIIQILYTVCVSFYLFKRNNVKRIIYIIKFIIRYDVCVVDHPVCILDIFYTKYTTHSFLFFLFTSCVCVLTAICASINSLRVSIYTACNEFTALELREVKKKTERDKWVYKRPLCAMVYPRSNYIFCLTHFISIEWSNTHTALDQTIDKDTLINFAIFV